MLSNSYQKKKKSIFANIRYLFVKQIIEEKKKNVWKFRFMAILTNKVCVRVNDEPLKAILGSKFLSEMVCTTLNDFFLFFVKFFVF